MNNQSEQPDVSVVVVSFNTRDLLRDCLHTLAREAGGVTYEVIVVDNASRDGSAEMVATEFPSARLIRSDINLGFAAANNCGFAIATGRYVVLLNSDAFLRPGALQAAVTRMDADQQVALGGGKLIGRDDSWQPSARTFPSVPNDFLCLSGLSARFPKSRFFGRADRTWADPDEPAEVDWVPGAFSIIRRSVLEEVGYFDERFFLYFEEVDLCRRMKAVGYRVQYWPDVVVVHLGGESSKTLHHLTMSNSGSQLTLWRMRSQFLYYRKHHGSLGAWLSKLLETNWHRIRAWKNGKRENSEQQLKAQDSLNIIELMERAWVETEGGMLSPPRPW
ncbi:MAG: glycosyltransferase family 2 protein [Blastocatellia bacterium]|nr:glycosyltransferase family 2 protein [Blastocatellia bacterium]